MALSTLPGWGERLEGDQRVEDEFTFPSILRDSLLDLKATVERVFTVVLRIGSDEDSYMSQDGQIWLQLKGRKREVEAAKLFVKGVVSQEAQEKVQYPDILHCVFCGAKGLFFDCLVRITSAHIVMDAMGCLLISGLSEPVVKAYSLIMNLVDKYRSSQVQFSGTAGESLDSRRAFKSLVEGLEDSHTLDLLVLPVLVKEILLDLVKQSGVDPSTLNSATVSAGTKPLLELQESVDRQTVRGSTENKPPDVLGNATFPLKQNGTSVSHSPRSDFSSKSYNYMFRDLAMDYKRDQPGEDASTRRETHRQFFHSFLEDTGARAQAEPAEEKNQEREAQEGYGTTPQDAEEQRESEQQDEIQLSTGSKQEYEHLLKFFTAMGFDEEVVCRVLARTGPREASQVLDLIQQEQDKSWSQAEPSNAKATNLETLAEPSNAKASNQETLPGTNKTAGVGADVATGAKEDDFVLGVLKKAAASCGYTEEKVIEVYSNLPELTPHELILELQKMGMKDTENRGDEERARAEETEKQHKRLTALPKASERDFKEEKRADGTGEEPKREKPQNDRGTSLKGKPKKKDGAQVSSSERMGVEPRMQGLFLQSNTIDQARKPELSSPAQNKPYHTIPPSIRGPPQPIYPSPLHASLSEQQIIPPIEPPAAKPKHKHPPSRAGAVVTGPQRFLEGLETPFVLQLKDDPGDPGLRQIIIDGSNVAMSHGLGTFFSCRGIALAVQYFWSQGHRKITVFVPQWRQKKDPKIKEQHFMTQLQDLGLLSFTPSREVMGQRINSYDDRLMLQLAQQTDGVIVTNDNMRDLVDESTVWKEIIKKRLLQYLFAGDLFMVPDDPLGRSGPHINDFLRTQNSPPVQGSHSFAGMASSFPPPSSQPRAHTEVLQYRERTPVGDGNAHKSTRGPPQVEREVMRSTEDTIRLKQLLVQIFPGQESVVMMTLQCYPDVADINRLSHFILEQQEDKG